ncbi:MAG: MFS transporter [Anaerolineaceae bacterium]
MNNHSNSSNSLWTRDFILVLLANALGFSMVSITGVVLSLYILRQFNGSPAQVGLIASLMTLSTFSFRPFTGYLVDRLGRKWTLIVSLLIGSLVNFCLLLPMGLTGLGILRFLIGFPFALYSTGLGTLTADLVPEEKRADGFNILSIVNTTTGQVLAPILGLWLLGKNNFSLVFTLTGILGILAVVVVLLMRFEDIKNPTLRFSFKSLVEKRVLSIALLMGLIFIAWPGLLTYGPLYAEEVGFDNAIPFLIAFGFGLLLSRPLCSRFLDLRAPRRAGTLALMILLVGFALMGLVKTQATFLLGGALMGMGYGVAFTTFPAMAVNLVEVTRRGACNATLIFCQDFGVFLGSYVYSGAAQTFGNYGSSYALIGLVMILPLIVFLFSALPDYQKRYRQASNH